MTDILDAPVRAPEPDPEPTTRRPGIAGSPRVDLLPQALRLRRRQKRTRRLLRAGLASAVVLVVLGAGGAFALNVAAQGSLAAARAQTLSLLAQQARYSDLKATQARIALIRAGQAVGAGTEVDWAEYLGKLRATLPGGISLTSVTVDSASPLAIYEQPTAPLQGPRIATLTFTATSPSLPDVPAWIDALGTLPAFVDAVPDSVTRDESGAYVVNMTLHIGAGAYSGRFVPQKGGGK